MQLLPLDAATYHNSPLHSGERIWTETNCYVDLWIELLHALRLPVQPLHAFTVSVDFEGDQFQFYKFPLEDLHAMYGIDVAEMIPWLGLELHIAEQLTFGRFLTAEVDSFYLPDTAGVSYRTEHTKTSIVANMIDTTKKRLGYFHGASYYELEADDYAAVLGKCHPDALAPYVELVKLDDLDRPHDVELVRRSVALLQAHLARRPRTNPIQRFRKRFAEDMDWLREQTVERFHGYAFVTVRQLGSCTELSAALCDWLAANELVGPEAGTHFAEVAAAAKAMQFKMARLASGRAIEVDGLFDTMEHSWDKAMNALVAARG